jgi:hypothetical protein
MTPDQATDALERYIEQCHAQATATV